MTKTEHKPSPPGFEAPAAMRTIDAMARAICSSNCAYRGVAPCWSIWTDRADAMEWPNPNCDAPGCFQTAIDVYQAIVPGRRKR